MAKIGNLARVQSDVENLEWKLWRMQENVGELQEEIKTLENRGSELLGLLRPMDETQMQEEDPHDVDQVQGTQIDPSTEPSPPSRSGAQGVRPNMEKQVLGQSSNIRQDRSRSPV